MAGAESHTVWVHPGVPQGFFPVPLPGTERLNFECSMSMTFPGPLDEKRLIAAYEETLRAFPHATGRLRRKDNDWTLGPSTRGVPLTFATTSEPWDHYHYPAEYPAHLMDTVAIDLARAFEPAYDEPMLRCKVTYCPTSNETIIAWSSCHIIGDGSFIYHFHHIWSQAYQGKKPVFGPPTYEKYRTAPADEHVDNPDTAAFRNNHLSHLAKLYPMEEWVGMATAAQAGTVQVDLLFTAHQLQQLRLVADLSPTTGATSAQDALSAYLITVLNRVLAVPITRVSSMLGYRGGRNPPSLSPSEWHIPGPYAVGNAIFQAHTPHLTAAQASSIAVVSRTIRASITAARDYAHIKRIVAISEPIWRRQSEESLEHQFWPAEDEGRFVFNSMPKADWSASHFGYGADKARAVIYGSFAGYARVFKPSAVKQADGTWNPNDGALWLFVRVPTAARDAFLAAVAADLMSPGFPQNLVRREREVQARILEGGEGEVVVCMPEWLFCLHHKIS
ncbi:hypothetical protein B0H14DRAFT_2507202 [Mycena olivaceomarginata]|nr:hypothetical protein B0H14DRAFT_2507202 [Mycena olivaceomarginata]